MPLTTAAAWREKGNDAVCDLVMHETPPTDRYIDCRHTAWDEPFYIYLKAAYAEENVEFLDLVDKYVASPSPELARTIYATYASKDSFNIAGAIKDELRETFDNSWGGDIYEVKYADDVFEKAYREVVEQTADQWMRFVPDVAKAKQDFLHQPPASFTPSNLDRWNQEAQKALGEGDSVSFFEIDGAILLETSAADAAPVLEWARREHGDPQGRITMVDKGGLLDPGTISAAGVQNSSAFEAAVVRYSKKKITY
jgi:hypothetical protein